MRTSFFFLFFDFNIQVVQRNIPVIPAGDGKIHIHFVRNYPLRYATHNLISVLQVLRCLYPDSRAISERNVEGYVSVVFGLGRATRIC